jgi:hypothetical protein
MGRQEDDMSPSVEDEEEERRRRRPEAEEDFLNTEGAEIWYEGGLGGWNTRELTSLLPMAVLGVAGWGGRCKGERNEFKAVNTSCEGEPRLEWVRVVVAA